MKRKRTLSLTLALGLMLAGLLAACGDSTATNAPAVTTAASAATTAAAAATTAAMAMSPGAAMTTAAAGAATTAAPAATTAAAGAATTAAATTGGNTTGVTDTEIVLGSWGPQSGPAAAYGIIDRTIDAYFKKINAEGGINGRKIKFIFQDDGYEAAKTQNVVKKLVEQDKVFAMVGGLGTANNLAVMDYLLQNNVPHIGPATGSTLISKPFKKPIFALQTNYIVEATLLTRYAIETLNTKKIAIFYQDDAFGKEGLQAITDAAKAKGQSIATTVSYQTTDKDFGSQALKLQQSGADTVIMWSTPAPTAAISKEMDKIGFKPTVVFSAVNNDTTLFKLSDNTIDGAWTASWLPDVTDPDNKEPKVLGFRDFMTKWAPNENAASGFAASGYAEAQVAAEIIKRAGKDLSRESLIKAAETLQSWNEGMAYNVGYSAENRQGQNAVYFMQASAKATRFIKKGDFLEFKPS